MNWLLESFGLEGTKVFIVFISSLVGGLLVASAFVFVADCFMPLPFFAIALSAWGVFLSLAGMLVGRH